MPFVRFARDRHGYEHVYLVDSSKERGRTRLLYWFRTPPGVKVGRSPFDPETQRAIERQNPGVVFDWAQIVAAKMPPPAPVENWREKRRVERAIKRARATEAAEAAESERVPATDEGPHGDEPDFEAPADVLPDELEGESAEGVEVAPAETPVGPSSQPPSATPSSEPRARRRRRRRGRRGPNRPPEANAGPAASNEPLDPPESTQKPSNEE